VTYGLLLRTGTTELLKFRPLPREEHSVKFQEERAMCNSDADPKNEYRKIKCSERVSYMHAG